MTGRTLYDYHPDIDLSRMTTAERNALVRQTVAEIPAEPRWYWGLREDGTSGWIRYKVGGAK